MRETSYHAVIAEMTVRALWELQNLLDYGEEYLALQSAAGSKRTSKSFGHPGGGE